MSVTREYIVHYQISNNDRITKISSTISCSGMEDHSKSLVQDYQEFYSHDPNFKILSIYMKPTDNIDWELNNRMRAVRQMCDLGRRVRADAKLRNRQPLRAAHIIFSDQKVQDYMIFIDCRKYEYVNILKNELNVLDVDFVEGDNRDKFFNYDLKPNFRTLGSKGLGKKAQDLKSILSIKSVSDKNDLYKRLNSGDKEYLADIELTIDDLEVFFVSKVNYASASQLGVGAIILDIALDKRLIEEGLVAEFRSSIQNIRKTTKLDLTDRIFLEVFCEDNNAKALANHTIKLKKDLLATGIDFFPFEKADKSVAHEVDIDDKKFLVHLYKENQ